MKIFVAIIGLLALSASLSAKDRLGVYQGWAAFSDPDVPRCYAIAEPDEISGKAQQKAYFSIGFWPDKYITHQIYVHLSRERSRNSGIRISVGGRRFRLKPSPNGGWAADRHMDMAIISAIRSSASLSVESIGRNGRPIVDAYALRGAPSAIDAAAIACARMGK